MSKVCQSCGGILGRDCFNPVECAEITRRMEAEINNPDYAQLLGELDYIRGVDMPAMEQTIQDACKIISGLIDMLPHDFDQDDEALKQAENFYRQHVVLPPATQSDIDDLPF